MYAWGLWDAQGLPEGTTNNHRGIAEKEIHPDCNGNGITDTSDLKNGTSQDWNQNGIPDECDIDDGSANDCNANGIIDGADIASGTSQDCNLNGVPDECDPDYNANGIPDVCEAGPYGANCWGLSMVWQEGLPSIGETATIESTGHLASFPLYLVVGDSQSSWNGVPLPFSLDAYGAPDCYMNANPVLQFSLQSDPFGNTSWLAAIPPDPILVGSEVYAQWIGWSPITNPLGLTFSDGLALIIQP